MEETNLSVPKAPNPMPETPNDDANSTGKKMLTGAAKGAAAAGAKTSATALIADGTTKAAAAAGHSFINTLANAASHVVNGIQSGLHAVGHFFGGAASAVGNFFGGAAAAASTTATSIATAVTVGVTSIASAGVIAPATNKVALVSDFAISEECKTTAGSSSNGENGGSGGGSTASGAELQKNAYIIYNTLKGWFANNGSANAENQAWGVLANIYRECGYNPANIEYSGTIGPTDYDALGNYHRGFGLVQWTSEWQKNHEHLPQEQWPCYIIAQYFKANNMPWNALQSQLQLLTNGNDPFYGNMVTYINSTGSSSDVECDINFLNNYEKPADGPRADRTKNAAKDVATVKSDVSHYTSTGEDDNMVTDILANAANMAAGTGSSAGVTTFESNENCYSNKKYDNSTIAKAAVSFAWPTESDSHNDGTAKYISVHKAIMQGDTVYRACDRVVSLAILWSGSDDDILNHGSVVGLHSYFMSSDKWEKIGPIEFGEDGLPTNCQPGDILLVTPEERGSKSGHVVVYTGNEAIKEIFPEADSRMNMVSGSIGDEKKGRSAGCGTCSKTNDFVKYSIYRCVKPDNSPKYKNVN